jgi:hypothetical protein
MAAYGTGIRAGRDFDERDTSAAPGVMLVNDAFTRREVLPAGVAVLARDHELRVALRRRCLGLKYRSRINPAAPLFWR